MLPSSQLPLNGRRILITAPRNYAVRLAEKIIERGGLPLLMPTIETCYLEDFREFDQVLQIIDKFDWLAFTSRNGITAFWQRMRALKININIIQKLSICAIGQDAEQLENLGFRVNLVPQEPSPSGIIDELAKIPNIANQEILVPTPQVSGVPEPDVVPRFIAGLKNLGMKVTRVNTYQTKAIDTNIYNVELDLIRQGKIDAIAFSSTAEITAFLQLFSDQPNCQVACFGPYTAANARKLGLDVKIIAKDFSSFAGFADALSTFFLNTPG